MGEYHVTVVGRSGGHNGVELSVIGPGDKRHAYVTAERIFRKKNDLPTSVALVTKVVYSHVDEENATSFYNALLREMDKEKVET